MPSQLHPRHTQRCLFCHSERGTPVEESFRERWYYLETPAIGAFCTEVCMRKWWDLPATEQARSLVGDQAAGAIAVLATKPRESEPAASWTWRKAGEDNVQLVTEDMGGWA